MPVPFRSSASYNSDILIWYVSKQPPPKVVGKLTGCVLHPPIKITIPSDLKLIFFPRVRILTCLCIQNISNQRFRFPSLSPTPARLRVVPTATFNPRLRSPQSPSRRRRLSPGFTRPHLWSRGPDCFSARTLGSFPRQASGQCCPQMKNAVTHFQIIAES